jgi:HPt (histidine-containing phosphotransfer) domain-containing protein
MQKAAPLQFDGVQKGQLDEGAFHDLAEAVGPDLLPQLIGRFEKDVNEQLELLMRYHAEPTTIEITALAHKLSGLLSQFGADAAARLAKKIEESEPQSRVASDLENLVDASRNCLRLIRSLLRQKNITGAEELSA